MKSSEPPVSDTYRFVLPVAAVTVALLSPAPITPLVPWSVTFKAPAGLANPPYSTVWLAEAAIVTAVLLVPLFTVSPVPVTSTDRVVAGVAKLP